MLKKIILSITISFFILSNTGNASYYKTENGSEKIIKNYNISKNNLGKEITRKEFVEILYSFYIDYKKDRGVNINYNNYKELDNSKIFTDINLKSDFGKKLSYFANIGGFSKNKRFNPNNIVSQKDFLTIMRRLKIMYSMKGCKLLKICEKEINKNTIFYKGTYIKYIL